MENLVELRKKLAAQQSFRQRYPERLDYMALLDDLIQRQMCFAYDLYDVPNYVYEASERWRKNVEPVDAARELIEKIGGSR